ncbi:hypothetical protein HMPREF1222_01947 [Treponema vincentii F0403]|uniref:DUF1343 domain-containing protein n=1 Tax=Treponema vincentii F0403 TaxID=1125702 RepID=S3L9M0_9SPIR|nr:DUF1343 domain-containing protein [Treponema vincentii]EPF46425.1 hypothetical protein HMPREF1222_01947 [Treponema vincentii F0403]
MKQTSVQYTLDTLDTLVKITRCRLQRIKTMGLLFFLLCVACGNAAAETRLKLGIERLPEYREVFAGKRVGLITNQTGIDAEGTPSAVLLSRAAQLTVLFSPEHGIQGNEREGASIGHSTDPRTGLPVYSLYGNTKRPTPEMLKDIDVLCFDIQDVGARFYTYISTMAYSMEECARHKKRFVVFDRPNPIGGSVEGNMLELEYRSFTGYFPIVQRHGMTVGELALLFNTEYGIRCDLTVIPMEGWNRTAYFDELPLIWVPPSPNIPSAQTALVYAGVCLFEGTNLSVGRGTAMPFQYLGAPYIDAYRLAEQLNRLDLDGVRFLPAFFTPTLSLYAGKLCGGVQIAVTDPHSFAPVKTAIAMFYELKHLYPNEFTINNAGEKYCGLHLLTGCTQLTDSSQTAQDYFTRIEKESAQFSNIRKKYLLY